MGGKERERGRERKRENSYFLPVDGFQKAIAANE